MNNETDLRPTILVVEDIEEIRDGIEELLKATGYHVEAARDERGAVESARRKRPDLILISLGGRPRDVIVTAEQIRERAELGEHVPVVIFCIEDVDEGDEAAISRNVYATCPDNFDQLRGFVARLLREARNPV